MYVNTPADVCYARVRSRGRAGEELVERSYLQRCGRAHDSWLSECDLPVLYVDGAAELTAECVGDIFTFAAAHSS